MESYDKKKMLIGKSLFLTHIIIILFCSFGDSFIKNDSILLKFLCIVGMGEFEMS